MKGPNCNCKEIEGVSNDSRMSEGQNGSGSMNCYCIGPGLLHSTFSFMREKSAPILSKSLLFELFFNMQPNSFLKLKIERSQRVIKVVQMKDSVLDTVVFMELVIQCNAGLENALCKYLFERNTA